MEIDKINFDKTITYEDIEKFFKKYYDIINQYKDAKRELLRATLKPREEAIEIGKLFSVIQAKKDIIEIWFLCMEKSLLDAIPLDKIPDIVISRYIDFYADSNKNAIYSREEAINMRKDRIFDQFHAALAKDPSYLKNQSYQQAYRELGIDLGTFYRYMSLLEKGYWLKPQIIDTTQSVKKENETKKNNYPSYLKASFIPRPIYDESEIIHIEDNSNQESYFTDQEKSEILEITSSFIEKLDKPIVERGFGR